MTERFAEPVVSVIVTADDAGSRILLQRRSKPSAGCFRGLYELPQGRLRAGETLLACAQRELAEETGLTGFVPRRGLDSRVIRGEHIDDLESVVVAETGDHSFLAVCLTGRASGRLRPSYEATDHRWVGPDEALLLVEHDLVFPLNVPMLKWYFRERGEVGGA